MDDVQFRRRDARGVTLLVASAHHRRRRRETRVHDLTTLVSLDLSFDLTDLFWPHHCTPGTRGSLRCHVRSDGGKGRARSVGSSKLGTTTPPHHATPHRHQHASPLGHATPAKPRRARPRCASMRDASRATARSRLCLFSSATARVLPHWVNSSLTDGHVYVTYGSTIWELVGTRIQYKFEILVVFLVGMDII